MKPFDRLEPLEVELVSVPGKLARRLGQDAQVVENASYRLVELGFLVAESVFAGEMKCQVSKSVAN